MKAKFKWIPAEKKPDLPDGESLQVLMAIKKDDSFVLWPGFFSKNMEVACGQFYLSTRIWDGFYDIDYRTDDDECDERHEYVESNIIAYSEYPKLWKKPNEKPNGNGRQLSVLLKNEEGTIYKGVWSNGNFLKYDIRLLNVVEFEYEVSEWMLLPKYNRKSCTEIQDRLLAHEKAHSKIRDADMENIFEMPMNTKEEQYKAHKKLLKKVMDIVYNNFTEDKVCSYYAREGIYADIKKYEKTESIKSFIRLCEDIMCDILLIDRE